MSSSTRRLVTHTLLALGGGLAVFLAELAKISSNPYIQAGSAAGVVTLGLLGAGVAKRSDP